MNEIKDSLLLLVCGGLIWWVFDCWWKGGYDDSDTDGMA